MTIDVALALVKGVCVFAVFGGVVAALLSALVPVLAGDGGAGDVELVGAVGVGAEVEVEVAAGVVLVGHVEDAGAVGEGAGGGAGRGGGEEEGQEKPIVHQVSMIYIILSLFGKCRI